MAAEFTRRPLPWTFRACAVDGSWEIVDSDGEVVIDGHESDDGPLDSEDAHRVVRCVNAMIGQDPCEVELAMRRSAHRAIPGCVCGCDEDFLSSFDTECCEGSD